MNEKIEKLADALDWDVSNVTPETHLDTLQWDSMAMLTIVAVARANGKVVKGDSRCCGRIRLGPCRKDEGEEGNQPRQSPHQTSSPR